MTINATILISSYNNTLTAALIQNDVLIRFVLESKAHSNLDDIFLGRVVNIDHSFVWVDIGLEELITLKKKPGTKVHCGEKILVQITRLSCFDQANIHHHKGYRASTNIYLVGRYCLYHPTRPGLVWAPELKDIRKDIEEFFSNFNHITFRANCLYASNMDVITKEIQTLKDIYQNICKQTEIGKVYTAPTEIQRLLRDASPTTNIIVEHSSLLFSIKTYLKQQNQDDLLSYVRLAKQTELPLFKHFGIGEDWQQLTEPLIRLSNGTSVYFTETPVATLIDVNAAGANQVKTNELASLEIIKQIALRDISGPIIVDFLSHQNPKERSNILEILKTAKNLYCLDNLELLGWTKLNHFELNRPRYRDSLTRRLSKNENQ